MADKQLIIVVEGTSAMGPYWNNILSHYLLSIIRSFCTNDVAVENSNDSAAAGSTFELAMVMFNTHGPYSDFLVRRSGWTRDVNNFLDWLSNVSFSGGGWCDVATAEGLAEALMMFAIPQNGYQSEQSLNGKRHCVLVSASNPYPLPTPVYRPVIENPELPENNEAHMQNLIYDAETVSKWFGQCSVSLSVICPKQLPKLRAIYNAAKHNQETSEPVVDVKQPHFLVLISDSFVEACAALCRANTSPSQSPIPASPPGPGLPASSSQANGCTLNKSTVSSGNVPQSTVEVEPTGETAIASGLHVPSLALSAASSPPVPQHNITNIEGVRGPIDVHMSTGSSQLVSSSEQCGIPAVSGSGTFTGPSQPIQNPVINSLSTATNSSIGSPQSTTNLQGNVNSSLGSPLPIGQGNVSSIGRSGTNGGLAGTASIMPVAPRPQHLQGTQSVGIKSSPFNMPMSKQSSASGQSAQTKYVKVWEGNFSLVKEGKLMPVSRLEAYKKCESAVSCRIAANWPQTIILARCISSSNMPNKQHAGKADFLVFRAMDPHGFIRQLNENKLCAVIQLPSQTLLLSASDKPCRLIGMLYPRDMAVLKPQIPSKVSQEPKQLKNQKQRPQQVEQQPPKLSQPQTIQQLEEQLTQQMQPRQHIPQQTVPQGQASSQGTPPSLAGSGFTG